MRTIAVLDGAGERWGAWFLSAVAAVPSFGWLLLSALFFGWGEYLSKKWALEPTLRGWIAVVVIDAIGVMVWLPALYNRNQLSSIGVAWVVLGGITTMGIGLLIFKESLTVIQWIGIFFAFVALILLEL